MRFLYTWSDQLAPEDWLIARRLILPPFLLPFLLPLAGALTVGGAFLSIALIAAIFIFLLVWLPL